MSSSPTLQNELEAVARRAGWNLTGVVDTERFDPCEPAEKRCRRLLGGNGTAVVFAAGGDTAWQEQQVDRGRRARAAIGELRRVVRRHGLRGRVVPAVPGNRRLPLGRLAEAAGLGVISPVLGVLLHPRYGPWVGVRAAVLLPGHPLGPVADASLSERFQPCAACAKPCLEVCPVRIEDDPAPQHHLSCLQHWSGGGCSVSCAARAACPVGQSERCGETAHRQLHGESMRALSIREARPPFAALRRLFGR